MSAFIITEVLLSLLKCASLMVCCGTARRGAGGGFEESGLVSRSSDGSPRNNVLHGLGALLVGVSLGTVLETLLWIPLFTALWFLGTKFTPHQVFKLVGSFTLGRYKGAVGRMCYFLPLGIAVYFKAHGFAATWSLTAFLIIFISPLPYYVGMKLLRNGDKAVVFGEKGYCLLGLMLWCIIQ